MVVGGATQPLLHVSGVHLDLPGPQARVIGRIEGGLAVGDHLTQPDGRPVGIVVGLTAYGRPLERLGGGMTAEVRVALTDGALPLAVPSIWSGTRP